MNNKKTIDSFLNKKSIHQQVMSILHSKLISQIIVIVMIDMYSSVIIVSENIVEEGASNSIHCEASGLLIVMKSFDFMFILHLRNKLPTKNDSSSANPLSN